MDEKIKIVDSLKELCSLYEKKYSKGSSLKPYKYYKNKDGKNEPVFFVGVPGMTVAFTLTILMVFMISLASFKASTWMWVVFVILAVFIIRMAMKIDKAKQIRYMALTISKHAMINLEKSQNEEDLEKSMDMIDKARHLLDKAYTYVDEPALKEQIDEIDRFKS